MKFKSLSFSTGRVTIRFTRSESAGLIVQIFGDTDRAPESLPTGRYYRARYEIVSEGASRTIDGHMVYTLSEIMVLVPNIKDDIIS